MKCDFDLNSFQIHSKFISNLFGIDFEFTPKIYSESKLNSFQIRIQIS